MSENVVENFIHFRKCLIFIYYTDIILFIYYTDIIRHTKKSNNWSETVFIRERGYVLLSQESTHNFKYVISKFIYCRLRNLTLCVYVYEH